MINCPLYLSVKDKLRFHVSGNHPLGERTPGGVVAVNRHDRVV